VFLRLFLSLHVLPLRSACSIKAQGVTIGPNQTEHAYGSGSGWSVVRATRPLERDQGEANTCPTLICGELL